MPVSRAMQIVGGNAVCKLSNTLLGQAFSKRGFAHKYRHGVKGYIVVQRDGGQIKEYLRRLADDADEDAF